MKGKMNFVRMGALALCVVWSALLLGGCTAASPSVSPADNAAGQEGDDLGLLTGGVLKVGMEIGYPPFESFSDDGVTPIGLDVDLAAALAAELGVTVEYENTAWDGIFDGLGIDKYDCVISAVTIDAERKQNMDFTTPYIENWQAIAVKKGSEPITSMEGLNGLNVGYQDETTSDKFLGGMRETGAIDCQVSEYEKVINCFDDLKLGRVDAVLCDSTVAEGYITRQPEDFEITWIQSSEPDAEAEVFGVAVKKGNEALLNALNKALDNLEKSGRLDELRDSWLS